MARGLSSCGSRALELRLSRCGAWAQLLHGMWDLARPGLEPVSPALAGGFLTTAPPGKSLGAVLIGTVKFSLRSFFLVVTLFICRCFVISTNLLRLFIKSTRLFISATNASCHLPFAFNVSPARGPLCLALRSAGHCLWSSLTPSTEPRLGRASVWLLPWTWEV